MCFDAGQYRVFNFDKCTQPEKGGDEILFRREYKKAEKLISEYEDSREGTGDELMWYLEHGTVNFVIEDYSASLKSFEKAEIVVNGL